MTKIPNVETIGTIPEFAENKSDELFIRLQLNYVEYGQLERLLAEGIDAKRARVSQLDEMLSNNKIPSPLTRKDIDITFRNIADAAILKLWLT